MTRDPDGPSIDARTLGVEEVATSLGLKRDVICELLEELGMASGVPLSSDDVGRISRLARRKALLPAHVAQKATAVRGQTDASSRAESSALSPVMSRLMAGHSLDPPQTTGAGASGQITRDDVLTGIDTEARSRNSDGEDSHRAEDRSGAEQPNSHGFAITEEQIVNILRRAEQQGAVAVRTGLGSGALTLLPYCIIRPSPGWPSLIPDGQQLVVVVRSDEAASALASFVRSKLDGSNAAARSAVEHDRWGLSRYQGASLVFCTPRVLCSRLADGPEGIRAVMFSELEDRPPLVDLILARILGEWFGPQWRPVVFLQSSIAIPPEVSSAFDAGDVISISGRVSEPEVEWAAGGAEPSTLSFSALYEMCEVAAASVMSALQSGGLQILVFLPTTEAALTTTSILRRAPWKLAPDVRVVTLDGRCSTSDMAVALSAPHGRQVLLVTSAFELLTFRPEKVDVLIDSGLTASKLWDVLAGEYVTDVKPSSKWEIQARWRHRGASGARVVALYGKDSYERRPERKPPKLLTEPLDEVVGNLSRTWSNSRFDFSAAAELPWIVSDAERVTVLDRLTEAYRRRTRSAQSVMYAGDRGDSRLHRTVAGPYARVGRSLDRLRWCGASGLVVWGYVVDISAQLTEVEVLDIRGEVLPGDTPPWLRAGNGLWLRVVDIDVQQMSVRFVPSREGIAAWMPTRLPGVSLATLQLLNSVTTGGDRKRMSRDLASRRREELLEAVVEGLSRSGQMPADGIPLSELGSWLRALQSDRVPTAVPLRVLLNGLVSDAIRIEGERLVSGTGMTGGE